jgi:hypothetical protein
LDLLLSSSLSDFAANLRSNPDFTKYYGEKQEIAAKSHVLPKRNREYHDDTPDYNSTVYNSELLQDDLLSVVDVDTLLSGLHNANAIQRVP